MTRICFIDTETTSLRPDRRAWEVGLIVREPGKPDTEHQWFVDIFDLDLGNADVMSLKIGRFYDRHPQARDGQEEGWADTVSEPEVMRAVERLTRGAHLVGAVPNFDADVLGARMRAGGICPSWHYHLCCVENLAVGYLLARAEYHQLHEAPDTAAYLRTVAAPPWKSDDLSDELGITVSDEDRHTALGDAKWARAIYDAVTGHG